MSFTNTGAAIRLSVGMSKNPWIWPAWRSSVRTRSAPAAVIMLATSLAEIGVRGARFSVLPGIAVIGNDGGHPPRRAALQRVEGDEQLHQVVVGRIGGRLDHENVLAAHVLVDLDKHLHIRKPAHAGFGQRQVEIVGDRFGERPIAVAGEDLHDSGNTRRCRRVRPRGFIRQVFNSPRTEWQPWAAGSTGLAAAGLIPWFIPADSRRSGLAHRKRALAPVI